ncbi:MAG TPA: sodium:solute symporter, partial [Lachnospiraceae bacterium]|nr:sodium:solute symporter [Lachnospiraceae bacterium]
MNNTQITALVIILLYMLATVAIGLLSSRNEAKKSNDDFLMASKSLGPIVLAGTLFAANTGGASTTGIATNVYQYGLSASWYVIAAGIGFILVSFIAPYFRRASANTVPQIVSMRYGKASHIFTAFTSIAALFMATGAQIIATASI